MPLQKLPAKAAMSCYKTFYPSPIGAVKITATGQGILSLEFAARLEPGDISIPPVLKACREQIHEYFRGRRKSFSVDLLPQGTAFQQQVWNALLEVPYGKTVAYGDIATAVGRSRAFRAVGHANNQNPIALIIPCHRIIGKHGDLVGYGDGLWRKAWLLKHEGVDIDYSKHVPPPNLRIV